MQISEAIARAEEAGILHGAFRPEDVWIDDAGRVLVQGFRMGLSVPDALPPRRYLAPEVLSGKPPSSASDQYALGIVVQEVLRMSDHQATVRAAPIIAKATAVNAPDRYRSNEVFFHALRQRLEPKRK